MKSNNLIVGLDVGTTKICAVVGEINYIGKSGTGEFFSEAKSAGTSRDSYHSMGIKGKSINIIGVGTALSKGIKKGVVTNIEGIVESIKEAVRQAEVMAGIHIKAVYIGITGGHIGCLSSHGVIAVKEREIGQREVDNVIEAAKAVAIPFDREMLHVIPLGFSVNGQGGITDPRGMGGIRLETNVRIITGAATSIQNLIKSCQKAGLEVIDIVFQPLASADAVLTRDEKDLGVAIIDIGGGTTDIALFQDGHVYHTAVLAIGGNNFTNDVAIGLRIPTQEAEAIKKKHGCSMISLIKDDEEIEIGHENGKTNKKIPRRYLVEILQPRAEELLSLVREEIIDKGFYKNMNSGIVLTGGAALMEGMDVMAENILELPVRIGNPAGVAGITNIINSPVYATGVGLTLHGVEECIAEEGFDNGNILTEVKTKIRGWIGDVFKM